MIDLDNLELKNFNAKEFYSKLETDSGLQLHKDFNVTCSFDDEGTCTRIFIVGLGITKSMAQKAAGIKTGFGRYSVSLLARDDSEDE